MAVFLDDEMKELRAYYSQLKANKTTHFRKIFKKENFEGKTVLNLSARIGWIATMCIRAGAAKVYASENSSAFIPVLEEFMLKNPVIALKIEVINKSVYCFEENEIEPVDIIITDNFDFNILERSSLHHIVKATKFLKPGGVVYPEKMMVTVQLFRYSVKDHIEGVHVNNFFENTSYHGKQVLHPIKSLHPMSEPVLFKEFDFNNVALESIENSSKVVILVSNDDDESQALGVIFNCNYTLMDNEIKPTEVRAVYFPENIKCEKGQPVPLGIRLSKASDTHYCLDIDSEESDVPHDLGCPCYETKCIVIREMMANMKFQ